MHKTVAISGATGGIGHAIAVRCAQNNDNLILFGRDSCKLEALKHEVEEINDKVLVSCVEVDFTNPEDAETIINSTFSAIRKLDVLINCSGMFQSAVVEDIQLKDWNNILNVNLTSIFLMCKKAVPILKEASSGVIINFSSIGGKIALKEKSAYSASKFAVAGFSKALAKELKNDNIKVHIIYPYLVDSKHEIDWDKSKDETAILSVADIAEFIYDLIKKPHRFLIEDIEIKPLLY